MTDRAWLQIIMLIFAALTAMASSYVWTVNSTATDYDWLYRLGLPAAAANFVWSAARPSISGLTFVFAPLTILSAFRIADFWQDWYITPTDETLGISQRMLGSFGWSCIIMFNLLVWRLEHAITARYVDERDDCWNAPGCPRYHPVSPADPLRH